MTERAHKRGVRVFVNYNPWDIGTRREAGAASSADPRGHRYTFSEKGAPAMADAEALAALIEAIGADGVFLDTMAFDDPGFRAPLEWANPHVVFNPEGVPPLDALNSITGSWLPHSALRPPKLSTIGWLEPRFSLRAIDREALDRRAYIQEAFFHGCGLVVWENIFGWWNPWSSEERALLRRCVRLLREHAEAFQDPNWQPYVATHVEGVYAHRWHSGDVTVHTLLNTSGGPVDAPVLTVPSATEGGLGLRHYDVWQGMEIQPEAHADSHRLVLSLQPGEVGCVVSAPADVAVALPPAPIMKSSAMAGTNIDRARVTLADLTLHTESPSDPVADGEEPEDMCRVPGGLFRFVVRHTTSTVMEGACYGGIDHHLDKNHPPRYIELADYWMDATEVTNAAYREFLVEAHYMPRDPTHFLRHWQHAAGFSVWPWRDRFDPSLCNSGTDDTTPVDRYPDGGLRNPGHGRQCMGVDRKRTRRWSYPLRHYSRRQSSQGGGQHLVQRQRRAAQRLPREDAADVPGPRPLCHHRLPLCKGQGLTWSGMQAGKGQGLDMSGDR